jgi:hypothetical protein
MASDADVLSFIEALRPMLSPEQEASLRALVRENGAMARQLKVLPALKRAALTCPECGSILRCPMCGFDGGAK